MAFAEVWRTGTKIGDVISVVAEVREKERIKQIPGARWHSDARVWYLPLSWAACLQLRGVFAADLQVGPELNAWAGHEKTTRVTPCLEMRSAQEAEPVMLVGAKYPLYAHQNVAARFLATARQACVGDEMGVGKTAETIAALELMDAYPALIVCPNGVKDTWALDEFPKWAPHRKVGVVGGGASNRRKVLADLESGAIDVAVINWEALRYHTRLTGYGNIKLADGDKELKELNRIPLQALVADEAHRAKDPGAKQTRALWWLGQSTNVRIALTGTPIANTPIDMWAIMHFVDPAEWPSKSGFVDRYALQSWNNFGFMEALGIRQEMKPELEKFMDARFIRRTKAMVLPDLPPKVFSTRHAEMGGKQKKAYEAIRKEMIAELDSGILVASNPLTKLTRLLQFASAHGDLVDDGKGGQQLLLTDPSCKVDVLMEVAEELGGMQAVVFAESRQLIDIAVARLIKGGYTVGQITGPTSPEDRTAYKDAFQAGKLQFLCCTMAAGGTGLNLTAAGAQIFLQRSFSLILNKQADDRVQRPGNEHESIQVIDIITPNTVDELPHEAFVQKSAVLEDVVRDTAALKAWLAKKG